MFRCPVEVAVGAFDQAADVRVRTIRANALGAKAVQRGQRPQMG